MKEQNLTLFEILEIVDEQANQDEIKSAYKKLILLYHPDRNQDNVEWAKEMTQKINNAYEILKNSEKRKVYQKELDEKRNAKKLKEEEELRQMLRRDAEIVKQRRRKEMINTGLTVAAGGIAVFAFVALINEFLKD